LPPDSIVETDLSKITLPFGIQSKLSLAFLDIDQQLFYGVSYKLLKSVYQE
jgi:hypothetical protein